MIKTFQLTSEMNMKLSDQDKKMLANMNEKVRNERVALCELIEALQLIYDFKIYAKLGHSNIIKYLIHEHNYSESAAFRRYKALKLVQEMPETLDMFSTGGLSLTNAATLHTMTKNENLENKKLALDQIQFKTTDDAKKEMFKLFPNKEILETPHKKRIAHDKLSLTMQISDEDFELFNQLKARLKITNNNVFLKEMLAITQCSLDKPIKAVATKPSNKQRHIPAPLRRDVLKSAKYQCEWPGCNEKHFLEIDHIRPIKLGGHSTKNNLRSLCRTHNQIRFK